MPPLRPSPFPARCGGAAPRHLPGRKRADDFVLLPAVQVRNGNGEEGVTCLARSTGMYFTKAQQQLACSLDVIILPNFWVWHPTAAKDAEICRVHANIASREMPRGI